MVEGDGEGCCFAYLLGPLDRLRRALGDGAPVSLDWWFPSHDGSLLAYGTSESGSEISVLRILNVDTLEHLEDEIPRTRAASLGWEPDGSGFTELARWSIDTSDPATYDLMVYTLAVSPEDGQVGLFGYYGGFATWSEADGWEQLRPVDIENWDGIYTYSGAHRDSKGFYSLAYDANTGGISMSKFSTSSNDWVEKATWEESSFFPSVLTINGDEGDYYVTSNAGDHATVWRMLVDGSQAGNFYDTTVPNTYADSRGFQGIISNY